MSDPVQSDNKHVVVALGELLWDMLPSGKRAGGAPTNFCYHAMKNGADGYAVSALGEDSLGDELEGEIKKAGIKHVIKRNAYPTGTVEVHLNEGIPTYDIVKDVAWDHIPFTKDMVDLIRRADAVCYGTLACRGQESHDTIMRLLDCVRPGTMKYFDINLRGDFYSKILIEEQLESATVFKINDEEISQLQTMFSIPGTVEEVAKWFLKEYGLDYVILTAGGEYSQVFAADGRESKVATPHVEVADTVGAGDSFSGVFCIEILKGTPLHEAHKRAVNVADFVCTKAGAWPEYPEELPDYVVEQGLE